MWFRKKAPIFLECVGCGCLMLGAWKKVKVEESGIQMGDVFMPYFGPHSRTEFYCGRCAPPYDGKDVQGCGTRYFCKEPSRKVEVTEEGKPIKGGE